MILFKKFVWTKTVIVSMGKIAFCKHISSVYLGHFGKESKTNRPAILHTKLLNRVGGVIKPLSHTKNLLLCWPDGLFGNVKGGSRPITLRANWEILSSAHLQCERRPMSFSYVNQWRWCTCLLRSGTPCLAIKAAVSTGRQNR